MDNDQKIKNEFMIELRNHLMKLYKTTRQYTPGETNLEIKTEEKIVNKSQTPSIENNINRFYLDKKLCEYIPQNATEVIQEVNKFYKEKTGLENKLDRNQKNLRITLGNKEYFIAAYVSKESGSGVINIDCTLMPDFSEIYKKE